MNRQLWLLLWLNWRPTSTKAERTQTLPEYMNQKMADGGSYEKKALPTQDEEYATNITIAIYIEGMSTFRATSMDFQLDAYFQQRWMDNRLEHNLTDKILIRDVDTLRRLWLPDLYFANAKHASYHDVTQRNFLLWIANNGSVFYETRISLIVMCMMNLSKWPLDSQKCRLRIMSYAYDTDQLTITWSEQTPIIMNQEIRMPDMKIISADTGLCDGNYTTGVWSCVTAEFHVQREITHHITQSYIPSALIVVISWFSFWLDIDAVPARVSLSITTLLTLSTQANAARMALPEVSYMKAIDVWMGTCLAFVFGAMIEFTCANYVQRADWFSGEAAFSNKLQSAAARANYRQAARFAAYNGMLLASGGRKRSQMQMQNNRGVLPSTRSNLTALTSLSSASRRASRSWMDSPTTEYPVAGSSLAEADTILSPLSLPFDDCDHIPDRRLTHSQSCYQAPVTQQPQSSCMQLQQLTTTAGGSGKRVHLNLTPSCSAPLKLQPDDDVPDDVILDASARDDDDDELPDSSARSGHSKKISSFALLTPEHLDSDRVTSYSATTVGKQPTRLLRQRKGRLALSLKGLHLPGTRGGGAGSGGRGSLKHQVSSVERTRLAGRVAAQRIDQFSRYFFPAIFVVFNFIYWTYYVYYKDDFSPPPTDAPPVV